MQQNKAGEYQIPKSIYNPDYQKPIQSEVDETYQQIEIVNADYDRVENAFKQRLDRLFMIGDEIALARQNKLENANIRYAENSDSFIRLLAKKILFPDFSIQQAKSEADLIRLESEIGSEIFSNVPDVNHIKFFNQNQNHWFFYQETSQKNGFIQSDTLHYEIQPDGILKVYDKTGLKGSEYLSGEELETFIYVTDLYFEQVMSKIYSKNIASASKSAA